MAALSDMQEAFSLLAGVVVVPGEYAADQDTRLRIEEKFNAAYDQVVKAVGGAAKESDG